jgi:hypothetical protein
MKKILSLMTLLFIISSCGSSDEQEVIITGTGEIELGSTAS